jgi:hypothetical protein
MADTFDSLRKTVLAEVKTQRTQSRARDHARPPTLLGAFIEAALKSHKLSRKDFASRLDIELELADAILEGELPLSELDDGLLIDIARVIEHEPNELRILLGQPVKPTLDHVENGTAARARRG